MIGDMITVRDIALEIFFEDDKYIELREKHSGNITNKILKDCGVWEQAEIVFDELVASTL